MDVGLKAPQSETDIDEFVKAYHAFFPHRAIWDGLHEYDGQVPDFSQHAIARRVAALEHWHDCLGLSDEGGAPRVVTETTTDHARDGHFVAQSERDWALAQYACAEELFRWRDWRPHERSPGCYHGALDVSIYLKRPYAPPAERFDALTRHLRGVPEVLAAGRHNLCSPLSTPAIEQAIHAYKGLGHYYEQHLRVAGSMLAESGRSLRAFEDAVSVAAGAVREFVGFLREQRAEPDADFRMGPKLLAAMIRWGEQVDVPLEQLRSVGRAHLERNHVRLEELAGCMRTSVAEAFDALGRTHGPEHEVLAETTAAMAEVRAFLTSSGVVDVSAETTCHVVATPSFMRAGSAFMDAPGPFEQPGQPAYFYVTLPESEWPLAVREDWLAKLNPWGLRNTAAHEAYPGHLVQFLRLAQLPSIAARAFTSYACIEGWAHYAERLLIEAGYGADDPRMELAQLSMALLRDCRFIVALELHSGTMTIAEAADFMATWTHLAPVRCRQEAQRGAQDPGYLYYALGKLMMLRLRSDYERQAGQQYSLRRFHDTFLACGAPPLPLARRMMLADPGGDLV
jgi:Bacterial protein of unknown function (DUF885)